MNETPRQQIESIDVRTLGIGLSDPLPAQAIVQHFDAPVEGGESAFDFQEAREEAAAEIAQQAAELTEGFSEGAVLSTPLAVPRELFQKPALDVSRYRVMLSFSPEDGCYIGEMPELAGCKADGPDWKTTLTNLEASARTWIESARESGHPVPEQGITPYQPFESLVASVDPPILEDVTPQTTQGARHHQVYPSTNDFGGFEIRF